MEPKEKIPVWADIRKGKTVCICHAGYKGCGKRSCVRETVTRDKFEGWQQTMRRDQYGR